MKIYCCGCNKEIEARLTKGAEIYPLRQDLEELPFWKCDTCGNYVGCHHKTTNRTRPLGCIPTREIRDARRHVHLLLDELWKEKKDRSKIYAEISKKIGREYHTAEIRSVEEARVIYRELLKLSRGALAGIDKGE